MNIRQIKLLLQDAEYCAGCADAEVRLMHGNEQGNFVSYEIAEHAAVLSTGQDEVTIFIDKLEK